MTMATTETFLDVLNLMLFVVLSDEKDNILTILELYVRIWGHIFTTSLLCNTLSTKINTKFSIYTVT